jgi:hypothetical protein
MMIFFLRYALFELIETIRDEAFDFFEMSLLLNSVL